VNLIFPGGLIIASFVRRIHHQHGLALPAYGLGDDEVGPYLVLEEAWLAGVVGKSDGRGAGVSPLNRGPGAEGVPVTEMATIARDMRAAAFIVAFALVTLVLLGRIIVRSVRRRKDRHGNQTGKPGRKRWGGTRRRSQ